MLLTSRDNRLIKEGRRLLADSRYRRESGRFLIEGARLCADAALSGVPIEAALATPRAEEAYARQMAAIPGGTPPRGARGSVFYHHRRAGPPSGRHGLPAGDFLPLRKA